MQVLSAYSGEQALASLKAHPDVALMLLDIVMETQSAGLDLISQIREVMGLGLCASFCVRVSLVKLQSKTSF